MIRVITKVIVFINRLKKTIKKQKFFRKSLSSIKDIKGINFRRERGSFNRSREFYTTEQTNDLSVDRKNRKGITLERFY